MAVVDLRLLVSGLLPVVLAAPVFAQTPPGENPPAAVSQAPAALAPVTVTATKTPRALDEVPNTVNIVGPEEIERRVPRDVDDVIGDIPGVEMTGGPRRSARDINIRGFDGQRVVTTIDGARQNFDAGHKGRFFIDPDLLKQVEVLKGPGSTLYGSGALGGVVAMRTKDASDFLEPGETAAVRGKYGYSTANREPLYSATAAARFGGGIDVLGNFTRRFTGTLQQGGDRELANSAEDLASALVKVGIAPGNGHRVSFSHNLLNQDGEVPSNAESQLSSSSVLVDRLTEMRTSTIGYGFENPDVPLLAPNFTLYRNETYVRENRIDGTARVDETDLTTTGFDLRNTSRLDGTGFGDHALTYGVEYYGDNQEARRDGAPRPGYPGANSDVTGFYLQDEIVLGAFSIIPGARYDRYELSSDASARENSESRVSPKIGGVWRAAPWINLFASYAEAFRAPSLTEMFISGAHFPGNTFVTNPDLKPETAKTIETGARLRFQNVLAARDSLLIRGSVFRTEADDYIDLFIVGATAQYQNIPEATIRGAEGDITYDTPYLFGGVGYSHLRGRNERTERPLNSIIGDRLFVTAGGKAPEWDLVYGVRSQFVKHQRDVDPTMFENVPASGGYAVHGIFASWAPSDGMLRNFRLDAGVDNIFDKAYRQHLSSLYETGRDFYGAVSYTVKF